MVFVVLFFIGSYQAKAQALYFGKVVSTLAGNGTLSGLPNPQGVAADGLGNLYLTCADGNIRKVTSNGVVSILAGNGSFIESDGPALSAGFGNPIGIAVDATGTNVYVADYNYNTIRKISGGNVVTIAGSEAAGHADSYNGASFATFNGPMGLALNPSGTVLYVADYLNNTIRAISLTGTYAVSTYAGTYGNGNSGGNNSATNALATFSNPIGVATDASGNLYVADNAFSLIRKIAVTGGVTTFAGSYGTGPGFADGQGTSAKFAYPYAVAVDQSSGNLYVSDQNYLVRMITPAGQVTTLAGVAGTRGFVDGIGSVAQFDVPNGVAFYNNNVFVSDIGDRLRQISPITSMSGFSTTYNTPSATQSIDVGGYNLSGNVTVAAPTGYEVSLTSGSGYGSSVIITPVSGNVAWNTVIYLRIAAGAAGSVSGNLTLSGGGASSQLIPVSGTIAPADQTITFGTLSPVTYGVSPFTLTATATSGLTVYYTSSDPTVATLSGTGGSTVTIKKVGTVTIYANEPGSSNYNAAPQVIQTLTVDPVPQTITFNTPASHAYGSGGFYIPYSISSGLLASNFTSSNPSVATIDGTGLVTIVGAGSTNITISQAGDATHAAAPNITQTLAITKANQTTSICLFSVSNPATFPVAPFTLCGSVSSNLPIVFSSSNTSVATVNASTGAVTIVGAGSTTFSVDQPGNANYNVATTSTSVVFQVNQGVSGLTFGSIATVSYGVAPFSIATKIASNSPGTITYSSANPGIATIDANTGLVTVTGAGSTTFFANQAATTNYSAGGATSGLQVNKASQTITFNLTPSSVSFGASPIVLNAVSSSGLPISYSSVDGSVGFVSGNTLTIGNAGTTTIYANQSGNSNYQSAGTVPQTLTVNPANQTINFSSLASVTYGDSPFVLTATANSGLSVSYSSSNTSVATVSGSTVTIVGAGSTTIMASQAGNSNYNSAVNVPQSLVVNKGSQTISFSSLASISYGSAPITLNATSSSGLPVFYTSSNTSVATISGNTLTIVGAGSTTIIASQAGNVNYSAATSVNQNLAVGQASQTITFGTLADVTYGESPFTLSSTSSSGLPVSYSSSNTSVATVSGNTVTIVGAGSTTITASESGNSNYKAATSVNQNLSVGQSTQTITFGALAPVTYGALPLALIGTSSSGLPVSYSSSNTSVATVSGNTVTIVGAGSTTIIASQIGNVNYNAATSVNQNLTVYQASQTITFATFAAVPYGTSPFALSGTSSSNLPVSYSSSNTSVATVSGNTLTVGNVGTTTIYANQSGNSNYLSAAAVPQTLSVNPANQTINFSSLASVMYGDSPFSLTATASSGLSVSYSSSNTSVATVSGTAVTIVGIGSTTITASQAGNSNYNSAVNVPQTLVVNKTSQTISFGSLTSVSYGSTPFTLNATSSSGLPVSYSSSNTSVATVSGNMVTIVGAGSTTIIASQAGNVNYSAATSVNQNLAVGQASQTITFRTLADVTFGDSPFTLSSTSSSGLPVSYSSSNTSVATVSGNMVTIVGAGSTTIIASQVGNVNYGAASNVNQNLSVNQSNQTITFGTLSSVTFGDSPFTLGSTSSSGLPVSYSSSNTSVATVSGNTVTIVGAGSTTINASQVGNVNYSAATSINENLTIDQASQTITFGTLADVTYGGSPFMLSGTSSSGLPVSYSSSNTSVATVSGNTVTIVGAGSTTINASQVGNINYSAAVTSVNQNLTVEQASQTITFNPIPIMSSSQAPFDLSTYVSSSSGLTLTYTSSNPTVATVSGSIVTIVGTGTTTIIASQAGNTNYSSATNVSQQISIELNQTITFNSILAMPVNQAPFDLSNYASASSGLALTYSSSNPTVATISGSMVTIVGVGTTTITAQQSGNTTYAPAINAQQSLAVFSKIISLSGATVVKDTLAFGNVILGLAGMLKFTITNTGSATLTISSINYPVGFSGDHANGVIVAGGTLDVNVTYTPTTLTKITDAIVFTSDATSGLEQLVVTGTGVKITGIEESPTQFLVYPNPSNGLFTLEGIDTSQSENPTVEIIDASGRFIGNFSLSSSGSNKYLLDITSESNGLYLLNVSGKTPMRLIKK